MNVHTCSGHFTSWNMGRGGVLEPVILTIDSSSIQCYGQRRGEVYIQAFSPGTLLYSHDMYFMRIECLMLKCVTVNSFCMAMNNLCIPFVSKVVYNSKFKL